MATILKVRAKNLLTKDGKTFTAYKFCDEKNNAVELRFNRDSKQPPKLEDGIYNFEVSDLKESKNSFYPRFYCNFISIKKLELDTNND